MSRCSSQLIFGASHEIFLRFHFLHWRVSIAFVGSFWSLHVSTTSFLHTRQSTQNRELNRRGKGNPFPPSKSSSLTTVCSVGFPKFPKQHERHVSFVFLFLDTGFSHPTRGIRSTPLLREEVFFRFHLGFLTHNIWRFDPAKTLKSTFLALFFRFFC